MTRKVSLYVADIVTYMEKAESFVEGLTSKTGALMRVNGEKVNTEIDSP